MIRLLYWFAILVEFLLVLVVLSIFIITDARTIKFLAEESLLHSKFTYKSIEGNFFKGLELQELAYDNKILFDALTVHWNPLTLIDKKITLNEVVVKGVEVDNIIKTISALESNKSSSQLKFNFLLSLNNIHLDINPYSYEGVKFSSFLFETDNINIGRDFIINTALLKLSFDSDLVNVKLRGKIDKNMLRVNTLNLKEIDSKEITKFVARLSKIKSKKKRKDSNPPKNKNLPFFKKIKIKHIFATLKDVNYNPLKITDTQLVINHAEIYPLKNFSYKAKKVKFTGVTNFGEVSYKGYIKNSTIYSKGELLLSKELFKKYKLPLNYETLKTLKGSLKLNHKGVWLEAKHSSAQLLEIQNAFNLDILQAEHKLYYEYSDNNLTIDSALNGKMPYANHFDIKNKVVIDNRGFRYKGKVRIPKVKGLNTEIAPYLLDNLKGKFYGDSSNFLIDLDSNFLMGIFETHGYKTGNLELRSKMDNIALEKIVPNLPNEIKNELIGVESKTFFDFSNNRKSKVVLKVVSNIINLESHMGLSSPFKILFKVNIPKYSFLRKIDKNINFSNLNELEGEVLIENNKYFIKVKNSKNLMLSFDYDAYSKVLNNGVLILDANAFSFGNISPYEIKFNSNIDNIENILKSIKRYYKIELPNIQGQLEIEVLKEKNGALKVALKSPNLKYLVTNDDTLSVTNIYDIDILFIVDKNFNIKINHYKFKIEENEYLSSFYSKKKAHLSLKDNNLIIKKLWINDKVLVSGSYNLSTSLGNIHLNSKQYSFTNKDFDLLFDLNLEAIIEEEGIVVKGDVDIFGNIISYEVLGSDIVEDSDIIIVQEMRKNEKSPLNNLKLQIRVRSKKALNYVSKDTNIEFFNEFYVVKNYFSEVMLTGMTTITNGYYQMEDKRFILNESHIYFAGDPKKPLLDIKVNYEKDEYTVHIFISGSTEEPIVNFNSEPYLTQQEILSLILFDGTGTSSGDGAEAYTLLGGTFAKGLIKSLGIDVDHLLLGTDSNDDFSFEIGRKISDNVTVMYLHEDGKDGAKVRIEHNKNFETDIIIQPPNTSSIEFLYKQTK